MPLNNPWVGYTTRSYSQIKDSVLTKMQALVPEMTDHTESNIFVKMVGIWAGIAEMLGYYIDSMAREAHLSTARLYWSGIKIAKAHDYRVHSHLHASGAVTFIIDAAAPSDIVIPLGTQVESDSGYNYFTTEVGTILSGNTEVTVAIAQYEEVSTTTLGTSDGLADQVYTIEDQVDDGSVVLKVDGLAWQGKETLGYSLPAQTDFVQTVNEARQPIVYFGDGRTGSIPPSGGVITIEYRKTVGELGNVGVGAVTTLTSSITLPAGVSSIAVTNRVRLSGGSNVESLAQLQANIPKSIRTMLRAVTEEDYVDIAELKTGVERAGVSYNCGKDISVYIVPNGGGIASPTLLADTLAWFQNYKMVTTNVVVYSAGEVTIQFDIVIRVLSQYTRSVVSDAAKESLVALLSSANQVIGGTVVLGDVYEAIETTEGVDNSTVNKMVVVPFARPIAASGTLVWTRSINLASVTTTRWEISIISGTTFEVIRDVNFMGVFTIGNLVTFPEVNFTINSSSYTVGDKWEFYTYPSFGTVQILETSIPITSLGDITVTATGGI